MARPTRHSRIASREELLRRLAAGEGLAGAVFRGVDLSQVPDLEQHPLHEAIFLGCTFRDPEQEHRLVSRGATVFPTLSGLPYEPYRRGLYVVPELLEGYEAGGYVGTRDFRIYAHYDHERRRPGGVGLRESLAQRLHDHAIDDALGDFLRAHGGAGPVGIMGGHGVRRSDPSYARVARLTWLLAREGRCVISGGGPGIMEAANLGAWLGNDPRPAALDEALELLRPADKFDGGEPEGTPAYLAAIERYFACARQVHAALGGVAPVPNLAMPTWFYGHEPTNLFATHVAKYFSNSLREDGLLAIATGGVVYAPGSAGTLQEIFLDLAQNHYASLGSRSPMVFLGRAHYGELFQLLTRFARQRARPGHEYEDLLALVDEPEEALEFLRGRGMRPVPAPRPLYELVPPPGDPA